MVAKHTLSALLLVTLVGCGSEELPENANGRELFIHYCSSCHEKDGGGNFMKGIPANSNSDMSASDIMSLIRQGHIDKPEMPVFDNLSRREALLISNYVKEQLRN
ncbi:MAG: c-type cytochrome [Neptuniibacter sp.]